MKEIDIKVILRDGGGDPIGKKEDLLEMAENGEDRPTRGKHPLGKALSRYTTQSSCSYDELFRKELEHIAPHWFRTLLFYC
jgi:hypothetical protein